MSVAEGDDQGNTALSVQVDASWKAQQSTAPASGRSRLQYRPGLDGLRALAVGGVFLYHANVSWMPGGFLGVDLFFVLSGYLITSLLLAEYATRGSVKLTRFWGRRARRLFPAVVVVILFALLATLTVARDDLSRTRADALSALVYMTNWHEIIASHSYFNQFGRPSLLEHLWSLAVEEQFYVLWPLMLIVGLRWLRRRGMMALTVCLAVASVTLMWVLYNPNGDPSRVYYGTDTRAFTLLIGALLAFAWPAAQPPLQQFRRSRATISVVGLVALAGVLAMFVSVQDYYPWLYRGGFLLMALTGAVLVAAASYPGALLGRALGWAPLRWLGERSYGIYLWHWPIMELTRPRLDVPMQGAPLITLQALAAVGAAALSYRYVEMPIRSGRAQRALRAWLDGRAPRERLRWVTGSGAAAFAAVGLLFGLPAPTVAGTSATTATASARVHLRAATTSAGTGAQRGTGVLPVLRPEPVRPEPRTGALNHKKRPPGVAGALPSGPILALGDSVMLGAAQDLQERLGHRLTVDAVVGRQAQATIQRIGQYRAAGRLPQTVVVQIGNNGPVWYQDMQELRSVLRGVPRVVIVNVRLQRSWQNEVNAELKSYVKTWPQAVLANWYQHSTWAMLTDGVHPSVAARWNYVRVIVAALKVAQHRWTVARVG
ncbi:MAG: acyltransferase family protein [Solirubrobacteraceae bacterium]